MTSRWLPAQHRLPDGSRLGRLLHEGTDWQIYRVGREARVLVARSALTQRWVEDHFIADTVATSFTFADEDFKAIASGAEQRLEPVAEGGSPDTLAEGLAFAHSLRETRKVDATVPLHDALYAERYSRLLPTWTLSESAPDEVVLGRWLTGGVAVPATAFRRVANLLGLPHEGDVQELVAAAGLAARTAPRRARATRASAEAATEVEHEAAFERSPASGASPSATAPERRFRLAGRPALENFLNEHIIDIVENPERYRALGIEFPSALVLHGPPGCGKTFAVERLGEYLDWPIFLINSNSVGSPYVHETARKVGAIFDEAMASAPSMIVIEEMEAYLADRTMHESAGLHHVEEVGEFLRRIPEANARRVLVVGTTNRLEMIDPAVVRRGRFDHVIAIGMPSSEEVAELLATLLRKLPRRGDLDTGGVVEALSGRALSDTAFVVREAARRAARAGRDALADDDLRDAIEQLPALEPQSRPIGFVHS